MSILTTSWSVFRCLIIFSLTFGISVEVLFRLWLVDGPVVSLSPCAWLTPSLLAVLLVDEARPLSLHGDARGALLIPSLWHHFLCGRFLSCL